MKPPRGLSEGERALWAQVALTVRPLQGRDPPIRSPRAASAPAIAAGEPFPVAPASKKPVKGRVPATRLQDPPLPPATHPPSGDRGLDSHWERRLRNAAIAPDLTLDLHGHSLDQAHRRLNHGLAQAKYMGARMVLVITGKPRQADAADRATSRGAIRAKILDWIAAGPHASDIAAVRAAHRRHGGEGALYLVLKRRR